MLKRAERESAYLKAGILGFAGSGKTHTAMLIALGIAERLGSKKPIGFVDTETGSDFWIQRVEAKGLQVVRDKSRAFQDLLANVKEAEAHCDVLVIDSISHVWKDFLEGYMKKLNRTRLQFQDWNVIKPEWGRFTDLYLNSKLHIVMCGRAGWEYDHFTDEETGKKELMKTGTKMKAESEMGYEPSLLLEMERVKKEIGAEEKKGRKVKIGSEWIHRCHVLKDRDDIINGKTFDNPTFTDFLPVFEALNIGGPHLGIDTSKSSAEIFSPDGQTERTQAQRTKQIILEEIQGDLLAKFPSATGGDKRAKLLILKKVFGTSSWTKTEGMSVEELKKGQGKILDLLNSGEYLEELLREGERVEA